MLERERCPGCWPELERIETMSSYAGKVYRRVMALSPRPLTATLPLTSSERATVTKHRRNSYGDVLVFADGSKLLYKDIGALTFRMWTTSGSLQRLYNSINQERTQCALDLE